MQYLIPFAVVSVMVLYVLIIASCLCYIGRHGHRTAVKQLAGKEPLDISNTAQFRDACLAAARLYGWKGESQVNVSSGPATSKKLTERGKERKYL